MEWQKGYLDLILVPLGLLISIIYHGWLWHRVSSQPRTTFIGINSAGRRIWVLRIIKDNEKKNILAVQTFRNAIMGGTLMATTSVLLCCSLAAVLSSTYSIKQPLSDAALYGGHGESMMALKYVTLLVIFLFAFICYSLSIGFINQINILVNSHPMIGEDLDYSASLTPEYLCDLLERGFVLNTVGNRTFYTGLPLLLWIFGPVLVLVCSIGVVCLLYHLDVVVDGNRQQGKRSVGVNVEIDEEMHTAV